MASGRDRSRSPGRNDRNFMDNLPPNQTAGDLTILNFYVGGGGGGANNQQQQEGQQLPPRTQPAAASGPTPWSPPRWYDPDAPENLLQELEDYLAPITPPRPPPRPQVGPFWSPPRWTQDPDLSDLGSPNASPEEMYRVPRGQNFDPNATPPPCPMTRPGSRRAPSPMPRSPPVIEGAASPRSRSAPPGDRASPAGARSPGQGRPIPPPPARPAWEDYASDPAFARFLRPTDYSFESSISSDESHRVPQGGQWPEWWNNSNPDNEGAACARPVSAPPADPASPACARSPGQGRPPLSPLSIGGGEGIDDSINFSLISSDESHFRVPRGPPLPEWLNTSSGNEGTACSRPASAGASPVSQGQGSPGAPGIPLYQAPPGQLPFFYDMTSSSLGYPYSSIEGSPESQGACQRYAPINFPTTASPTSPDACARPGSAGVSPGLPPGHRLPREYQMEMSSSFFYPTSDEGSPPGQRMRSPQVSPQQAAIANQDAVCARPASPGPSPGQGRPLTPSPGQGRPPTPSPGQGRPPTPSPGQMRAATPSPAGQAPPMKGPSLFCDRTPDTDDSMFDSIRSQGAEPAPAPGPYRMGGIYGQYFDEYGNIRAAAPPPGSSNESSSCSRPTSAPPSPGSPPPQQTPAPSPQCTAYSVPSPGSPQTPPWGSPQGGPAVCNVSPGQNAASPIAGPSNAACAAPPNAGYPNPLTTGGPNKERTNPWEVSGCSWKPRPKWVPAPMASTPVPGRAYRIPGRYRKDFGFGCNASREWRTPPKAPFYTVPYTKSFLSSIVGSEIDSRLNDFDDSQDPDDPACNRPPRTFTSYPAPVVKTPPWNVTGNTIEGERDHSWDPAPLASTPQDRRGHRIPPHRFVDFGFGCNATLATHNYRPNLAFGDAFYGTSYINTIRQPDGASRLQDPNGSSCPAQQSLGISMASSPGSSGGGQNQPSPQGGLQISLENCPISPIRSPGAGENAPSQREISQGGGQPAASESAASVPQENPAEPSPGGGESSWETVESNAAPSTQAEVSAAASSTGGASAPSESPGDASATSESQGSPGNQNDACTSPGSSTGQGSSPSPSPGQAGIAFGSSYSSDSQSSSSQGSPPPPPQPQQAWQPDVGVVAAIAGFNMPACGVSPMEMAMLVRSPDLPAQQPPQGAGNYNSLGIMRTAGADALQQPFRAPPSPQDAACSNPPLVSPQSPARSGNAGPMASTPNPARVSPQSGSAACNVSAGQTGSSFNPSYSEYSEYSSSSQGSPPPPPQPQQAWQPDVGVVAAIAGFNMPACGVSPMEMAMLVRSPDLPAQQPPQGAGNYNNLGIMRTAGADALQQPFRAPPSPQDAACSNRPPASPQSPPRSGNAGPMASTPIPARVSPQSGSAVCNVSAGQTGSSFNPSYSEYSEYSSSSQGSPPPPPQPAWQPDPGVIGTIAGFNMPACGVTPMEMAMLVRSPDLPGQQPPQGAGNYNNLGIMRTAAADGLQQPFRAPQSPQGAACSVPPLASPQSPARSGNANSRAPTPNSQMCSPQGGGGNSLRFSPTPPGGNPNFSLGSAAGGGGANISFGGGGNFSGSGGAENPFDGPPVDFSGSGGAENPFDGPPVDFSGSGGAENPFDGPPADFSINSGGPCPFGDGPAGPNAREAQDRELDAMFAPAQPVPPEELPKDSWNITDDSLRDPDSREGRRRSSEELPPLASSPLERRENHRPGWEHGDFRFGCNASIPYHEYNDSDASMCPNPNPAFYGEGTIDSIGPAGGCRFPYDSSSSSGESSGPPSPSPPPPPPPPSPFQGGPPICNVSPLSPGGGANANPNATFTPPPRNSPAQGGALNATCTPPPRNSPAQGCAQNVVYTPPPPQSPDDGPPRDSRIVPGCGGGLDFNYMREEERRNFVPHPHNRTPEWDVTGNTIGYREEWRVPLASTPRQNRLHRLPVPGGGFGEAGPHGDFGFGCNASMDNTARENSFAADYANREASRIDAVLYGSQTISSIAGSDRNQSVPYTPPPRNVCQANTPNSTDDYQFDSQNLSSMSASSDTYSSLNYTQQSGNATHNASPRSPANASACGAALNATYAPTPRNAPACGRALNATYDGPPGNATYNPPPRSPANAPACGAAQNATYAPSPRNAPVCGRALNATYDGPPGNATYNAPPRSPRNAPACGRALNATYTPPPQGDLTNSTDLYFNPDTTQFGSQNMSSISGSDPYANLNLTQQSLVEADLSAMVEAQEDLGYSSMAPSSSSGGGGSEDNDNNGNRPCSGFKTMLIYCSQK